MKPVNALILTVVLLAIVGTVVSRPATALEPVAQEVDNSEFKDKVVTLYVDSGPEGSGQILVDVEVFKLGDRMMLAGTCAETGKERWTTGLRVGYPLDTVTAYYVMTREQFDKQANLRQ